MATDNSITQHDYLYDQATLKIEQAHAVLRSLMGELGGPGDASPLAGVIETLLEGIFEDLVQYRSAVVAHCEQEKPAAKAVSFPRNTDKENLEQLGSYHDCQIDMLRTMFRAIELAKGDEILTKELAQVAGYLSDHFESDSDLLVRGMLEDSDRNTANREAIQ